MGNAVNTSAAIRRVIKDLTRVQKALQDKDEQAITKMLSEAQAKRNELVEKKIKRRELPT
jgi:hypothetical protein